MTTLVLAPSGFIPPGPPQFESWPGVSMSWIDYQGRTWPLVGNRTGVRLRPGVRGLTRPPVRDFVDTAAGFDGQNHLGFTVMPRPVFWPVVVAQGDNSQEWLEYDAMFRDTIAPGRVGKWQVTQPNGTSRYLNMRCVSDSDPDWGYLPGRFGWKVYGIEFIADDPYWYGAPVVVQGADMSGADPFIDEAGSPPFHISGGAALARMSIDNPGDVESWPVWEATGPHTSLSVGVGGHVITFPDLSPGEYLRLDTSPWVRKATIDGVDVTAELLAAEFAPVPAGRSVPLYADTTGPSGMVRCTITPRYWSAW